ncbi:sugar diacid recognition domain-containing protein [Clostridium sediminicola]|uniref:CdaR family transcriptional regulator n=1 Tax=Clostridium sediminicola TaxID=3114879 RepID=UPI0031F213A6
MILRGEMLQRLADEIIKDIGYNVNIIDEKGIIVASGSKDRVGTFHKIGKQAAELEKRIDIEIEDEEILKGVKTGINQPFYYNGKVIGVIGITGDPDQIDDFVKLVKSMIELMFEQEMLKQKMYYRQSNKVFFMNMLMNIKTNEDYLSVLRWGTKLGYDLNKPRIAIVLSLKEIMKNKRNTKMFEQKNIIEDNILNLIKKTKCYRREDILSYASMDEIILLKTIKNLHGMDIAEEVMQYAKDIKKNVEEKFKGNIYIGIGSYYKEIKKISKSYSEAEFVLNEILKYKQEGIGHIHDYVFDYFYSKISKESMEHFFENYYLKVKDRQALIKTIIVLTKSNMNIVSASKALFVHRNTVIFRLNKLKELLNLDPINNHKDRKFWDMLAIYIDTKVG